MNSLVSFVNSLEWRRSKVLEYLSKGHNQNEIADILMVSQPTVARDCRYIREDAGKHLRTHIQERMPEEYRKVEVSITQVLKKAWEIVDKTADERIRLQALSLIRECDSNRLEMITNGTVVSDALKYVNGKAEKLDQQVKAKEEIERELEEEEGF